MEFLSGSFDELYVKHRQAVHGAVGAILTGAEDREDASQAAWMKADQAIRCGAVINRAWLVTTAMNEARTLRRSKRVRRTEELPDSDTFSDHDPDADFLVDPKYRTLTPGVGGGKMDRMKEAITELPNELRVPLEAHLAGMTLAEIARRLGVSHQAVSKRLKQAEKKIAASVAKSRA